MKSAKFPIMQKGGQILHQIRDELCQTAKVGVTLSQIDALAEQLIAKHGCLASFKTVPHYHHATCINLNAGIVHGLPDQKALKPSDIVSIDLGLMYQNYHLDTSISFQLPPNTPKVEHFLKAGQIALDNAIRATKPGGTVYDISLAIFNTISFHQYQVVYDLTGHGIGHSLHEPPNIPCYPDKKSQKDIIYPGQALAIEVMYTMGGSQLKLSNDGWTIETADGSLSALFEETVFVTDSGVTILT